MKIALINEFSQAAKNAEIYESLKKEAEKAGHTVDNYGMFGADDPHKMTYVKNGLLASILLNSKAADFVVTGCGTGQGALIACNSFPGVICGHVTNPLDAYLFGQINAGNCVSIPYAQNYGWGGQLNLDYIFEKLFSESFGGGYPKSGAASQQANRKILNEVKAVTTHSLIEILNTLDPAFIQETIDYPAFRELFFKNCKDPQITEVLEKFLD